MSGLGNLCAILRRRKKVGAQFYRHVTVNTINGVIRILRQRRIILRASAPGWKSWCLCFVSQILNEATEFQISLRALRSPVPKISSAISRFTPPEGQARHIQTGLKASRRRCAIHRATRQSEGERQQKNKGQLSAAKVVARCYSISAHEALTSSKSNACESCQLCARASRKRVKRRRFAPPPSPLERNPEG